MTLSRSDVGFIAAVLAHQYLFAVMSGMLDSYKTINTMPACIEGIKRFLGNCGPERLLFGTDFPVQTHADFIQLIESAMIDFSNKDREQDS